MSVVAAVSPKNSKHRSPEGGRWSKTERFFKLAASDASPGPVYALPSIFPSPEKSSTLHHVPSPIFAPPRPRELDVTDDGKPTRGPKSPGQDRTGLLATTMVKNEFVYHNDIASDQGPGAYNPKFEYVKKSSPKAKFLGDRRFKPVHDFETRDTEDHYGTQSPGPIYYPAVANSELKTARPPSYTFGSKGMKDRSSFLTGMVKQAPASPTGGSPGERSLGSSAAISYMYTARPATSDPGTNVGPGSYSPKHAAVASSAPRPVWSTGEKDKGMDKIFISKKHIRAKYGLHSPGPVYSPKNYDLATKANKQRFGSLPAGTWCP